MKCFRLKGPRGIGIMESFFSDIKLKGKGKEKEDLDIIMGRLEHWAHRLFPRMQFDEVLKKIEALGSKKTVAVSNTYPPSFHTKLTAYLPPLLPLYS